VTTLPIAEAKAQFADVIRSVEQGAEVVITRGARRQPVAAIVPIDRWRESTRRRLGTVAHWGPIRFGDDWAISDEELLGEAQA